MSIPSRHGRQYGICRYPPTRWHHHSVISCPPSPSMATIQHRTTLTKRFIKSSVNYRASMNARLFFLAVLINIHRYTEAFANRFAEILHSLCDSTTKVVFMCCPTAFVAFQHRKRLDNVMLLEYDQRFAVLSPKQFVPYDVDEPDIFPKSLKGSVELAVVDPPFLNEVNHTSFFLELGLIFWPRSPIARLFERSVKFSIQPRESSF